MDPETVWFEISEFPIIDKSSARISQIFNEVWMPRYYRPRKLIFYSGSELNRNLIPLLKYFSDKPTCTTIKNSQENSILERIHQVVGSMFNTKDMANVTFGAVSLWRNILETIVYAGRC